MSRRWPRLSAAALSLAMLLPLRAQALTPGQAAALLEQFYVDPVSPQVLEQGTVEDMLDALGDPYTQHFTPDEYRRFTSSMSDASVVGIGVVCAAAGDGLLITQVLDNSPAQSAGLKTGDVIVEADGSSLAGMAADDAVAFIRGESGTQVTLLYRRDSCTARVTVTRRSVDVPTVTHDLLDTRCGYIRCTSFGPDTAGHFRDAVKNMQGTVSAWIVDLRGNHGGYTSAAADAAAIFTGEETAAILRSKDKSRTVSSSQKRMASQPVIVLVDQESASASELFAGAIRDYQSGIILGSRTFGKGVAQSLFDQDVLPNCFPDGDAIKITSYRFYSPKGNTTDQVGIIPDLPIHPGYALETARLLSGPQPEGSSSDVLRIDLAGFRYVHLNTALSPEFRPAFQAMLNALPASCRMALDNGSGQWTDITPAETAEKYSLSYTADGFTDLDGTARASSIGLLQDFGLVHGYGDNTFHPAGTLTRAELCQMLAKALGCFKVDRDSTYTDVAPGAWYEPAVTTLTHLGLVNGVSSDRFAPDAPLSHQQFITIVGRMARWLNCGCQDMADQAGTEAWSEPTLDSYADWARRDVWLMSCANTLLWDSADHIDPNAPTTREEAAYTLCRVLDHLGILPV